VADELRRRIKSGVLKPGQRMPTQARLADEFGVERGAVRQALRILQSEHLLTNVSKGSPATVADGRRDEGSGAQDGPQRTVVALGPRIAWAFEAERVEIDAVCLTSHSLAFAIGKPLRQIHAGKTKPVSVDVRVLLPSHEMNLAFPTPVDTSADDRVQRQWLAQRNAQCRVLRHNLLMLRATHGIDVRVSFRALPFTPPVKLYLLNGTEALFAYYTLSRRETEIDHEQVELYDAEGAQSMLFPFERGPGAGVRDTAFVEQSGLWFESLWNTISHELLLTD
jgi:hypothetical protein